MGVGFDKGEAAISVTTLDSWLATPAGPRYQTVAPIVRNCKAVMSLYFMTFLESTEANLRDLRCLK